MSAPLRRRRLSVHTLEDRVVPAVGDFVHTYNPPPTPAYAGDDIAVGSSYLAVGDPGRNGGGAVHIYDRASRAFLRTIDNPTPASGDYFGGALAMDGDYLVVGTMWDDTDTTDSGIAYVYRMSTGELVHTLHNPSPKPVEFFGYSVAVANGTVYVGASWDDTDGTASGSVYRYSLADGSYLGRLTRPGAGGADEFGTSVAAVGPWVAVGAQGDGPGETGTVHLFDSATGSHVRTIANPFPDPGPDTEDLFGTSVALDGDVLIVGAEGDNDGGPEQANYGGAYAFRASTGEYLRQFRNPDPQTDDRFGRSVAVANDVVVVGAPMGGPATAATNHGAAYAFNLNTGALITELANQAPSTTSAWFGITAAAYRDRLYVGAMLDGGGKVHEFEGAPGGPPTAVDDTATVAEDSPATRIEVLANDQGAVPPALTVTAVTQPQHGDAAISSDGRAVDYTPDPDYSGPDSFTYTVSDPFGSDMGTVTVSVAEVNDPPGGVSDSATAAEDSTGTVIRVLDNDTDEFPAGLSIAGATQPANGTVSVVADSTQVEYAPAANFSGTDTFTYTVTDGEFTDTVMVTVTVTPVNDPPAAADDSAVVPPDDGPTAVDVLANDSAAPDGGETLTIGAVTQGAHGAVAITGNGTGLTYAPAPGYTGPDSFTYTISDGNGGLATATVTVMVGEVPGNSPPAAVVDTASMTEDGGPLTIAVLANDSTAPDTGEALTVRLVTTPSHGTAVVAPDRRSVTYTPHPDFAGTDTFYYVVGDGRGGRGWAPVEVTVANDGADRLEVVPSAALLRYREGAGVQPLDAGLRVGTAAGDLITKAVLKFTGGYVKGRDQLAFPVAHGIKGRFVPGTGTLTLTGKAAPDAYEAALRSVAYRNPSDDPVAGARTVAITLYDAAGAGEPGFQRVRVEAVNDAPAVTLPPTGVTARVGRPAAVLGGLKVSDPDGSFLQSAAVTVENVQAGDVLSAVTAGTTLTASYANGVLTLSGSATVATYLKVLKSVKLVATGGVGLARTLSVTVNDLDSVSAEATRTVVVLLDRPFWL